MNTLQWVAETQTNTQTYTLRHSCAPTNTPACLFGTDYLIESHWDWVWILYVAVFSSDILLINKVICVLNPKMHICCMLCFKYLCTADINDSTGVCVLCHLWASVSLSCRNNNTDQANQHPDELTSSTSSTRHATRQTHMKWRMAIEGLSSNWLILRHSSCVELKIAPLWLSRRQ